MQEGLKKVLTTRRLLLCSVKTKVFWDHLTTLPQHSFTLFQVNEQIQQVYSRGELIADFIMVISRVEPGRASVQSGCRPTLATP